MSHPFQSALPRLGVDLLDLSALPNVFVELRYNGTNNFMNQDLYQGFNKAYLHSLAYVKFTKACDLLKRKQPHLKFLVYDALRPRSVQVLMYDFVSNTPMKDYVAEPKLGSLHNFGMAIDLTLMDEHRRPLDMGTEFDDFTVKAQPKAETELLIRGELTPLQIKNRMLLREVMEESGFTQLPHEWWHYNALPAEQVRGQLPIVE
jgi:D-alanyl-D-alanine dipeptidase